MKKKFLSDLTPLIDLAARLYLSYYLIEYGVSKLNGSMFNNTTSQMLNTPLKYVDIFHLTWYWFQQNILLSYFIGVLQIISATLLVINRTVLIGCFIALPVLFGIFLVDLCCTHSPALTVRVLLYNLLILFFCFYRRHQIKAIIKSMLDSPRLPKSSFNIISKILLVILFLLTLLIVETGFIGFTNILLKGEGG
jgi:uncharacterized membrane protein YphA (DoxX/SURF4 family)